MKTVGKKSWVCAFAAAAYLVSAVASATPIPAPSPAGVLTAMKWWIENGPKLQKAIGHDGFRAARPGVPFMILNDTDYDIAYKIQTKHCDWTKYTIEPGDDFEHHCKTTSGDNWFNISWTDPITGEKLKFSYDSGHAYYFVETDGMVEFAKFHPEDE
jgi:hypothetical protein